MSAPGETAPATLSAEWQAMAERTGRPFDKGGAYASDEFSDWDGCVAVLHGYGFTLEGAERFLHSKHMRWCADESSEGYGGATVAELTAYLGPDSSQWRSDFDMVPESVAARDKARAMASEQPAQILVEILGYLYPGRVEDGSRIASAMMLDVEHAIATLRDRAKQTEAERDAERAYRVASNHALAAAFTLSAAPPICCVEDAERVAELRDAARTAHAAAVAAESALRALGVTP